MFKKLNLRTQIILFVVCILVAFLSVQVCLYGVLQSNIRQTISTIFNSIAQNTLTQIENTNQNISEIAFTLSSHEITQKALYEYDHRETVQNLQSIGYLQNDFLLRNQSLRYLTIIKDNQYLLGRGETNLHKIDKYIDTLKYNDTTSPLPLSYFHEDGHTYFIYCLPVLPMDIRKRHLMDKNDYIICVYELNATISYAPYSFVDNEKIELTIIDRNNRVILSQNPALVDTVFEVQKNKDILSQAYPIAGTDWQAVLHMPSKNISRLSSISDTFIWLAIVLIILLTVLLLYFLNATFIKRMLLMKRSVKNLLDKDSTVCIQYQYDDEFNEIAVVVNKLLEQIDTLNQEKLTSLSNLYAAQLMQKESYIYYLYNQVSPHFLYNTMSHIQGLAFQYDADEIVKITAEFSKIFRYCSSNHTHTIVKEDLDYAVSYFNIVNSRREKPITLDIQIDASLYSIRCLKMIFQPILENSLKYAFPPDKDGQITIVSIPDPEKFILEFQDNGCGIMPERLQELEKQISECDPNKIQESTHIGLSNVHTRLKLFYQNDSGLKITSSLGHGTCVRITFDKELPLT